MNGFDPTILDAARHLADPAWAHAVFEAASEPAFALALVPIAIVYGIRGGAPARKRLITAIVVLAATDFLSGVVLKNAFPRVRPNGTTASFPSSHAANAFGQAVYFSLEHPKASPILLGVASLIALSRLSLGKHWPSDVLAGMLLGTAVATVAWYAARGLRNFARERAEARR